MKMKGKGIHSPAYLTIRYVTALALIAVLAITSFALNLKVIDQLASDARIINLAGRQRMLSQKITVLSLLLTRNVSPELVSTYSDELADALESWIQVHKGLQVGDVELRLPGENSLEVEILFAKLDPHFEAVCMAVEEIQADRFADNGRLEADSPGIKTIVANAPEFLGLMDQIVFRFEFESEEKVSRLTRQELYILAALVIQLVLEGLFIFQPMVRKIQSSYQKSLDALDKTAAQLASSNSELEDFTYVASHDLKEPLRGISRYSTILLEDYDGKLDEDGVRMLKTLPRLTRRLENMIDDLLSFSRVGMLDLAMKEVSLDGVLDGVIDSIHIHLEEHDIEIRRPRPLPVICCDSVSIAEVFLNLITNAMKYNDKDEKWIEIGWQDDYPNYNGTVFFVRDNGIGIPEKHVDKIFTMFKRLHARDKYGGGTGAGMTIAKKIIERHNGTIWLESQVNEGTTFFFTLNREWK